jgi:hypothetical protein
VKLRGSDAHFEGNLFAESGTAIEAENSIITGKNNRFTQNRRGLVTRNSHVTMDGLEID